MRRPVAEDIAYKTSAPRRFLPLPRVSRLLLLARENGHARAHTTHTHKRGERERETQGGVGHERVSFNFPVAITVGRGAHN